MDTKQTIGIWGFARVGTAAARCLLQQDIHPGIFDAQPLSFEQRSWCSNHNLTVWEPHALIPFLEHHELILPSPGIDLRPYHSYAHKWISEFDIFCQNYKKPLIAITGSVGKTSVTQILFQVLSATQNQVALGGNIGIGMLDLLISSQDTSLAVLELSSFQLEFVKTGAPDLAIITNIYPNHLDRHETMRAYMTAKSHIYCHQTKNQIVLMPFDVAAAFFEICPPQSKWYVFSHTRPITLPHNYQGLFFIERNKIYYRDARGEKELIDLNSLTPITFAHNWLIIIAAAYLLEVPLNTLITHAATFSVPEHRLEYIGKNTNGVTFYNDSKATTAESMLAAVKALACHKNIHLFIGGRSKGVDRQPAIAQLLPSLAHAYCFGAEAETIHTLCNAVGIASSQHATLEDAFDQCLSLLKPGEIVLLSPGGASYDLFTDYQERGKRFTMLVKKYLNSEIL